MNLRKMKRNYFFKIYVICLILNILVIPNYFNIDVVSSKSSINITHSPIRINSDLEFISANGIISGNGTILDPYLIENLTIDASIADGITIGNTTSYFIIQNCNIYTMEYPNYHSGIVLTDIVNGILKGISINNTNIGINIEKSNNLILQNISLSNVSGFGIQSTNSNNNTYRNISVYAENSLYSIGFGIHNTIDNFFNNITIHHCNIGIDFTDSVNITLIHSNIYYNGFSTNDGVGIGIYNSEKIFIIHNNIYNNTNKGIDAQWYSNNCQVLNNEIYYNRIGLDLQNIIGWYLFNNSIKNNFNGLFLYQAINNTLYNNDLSNFQYNFGFKDYYNLESNRIASNNTVNGKHLYFLVGQSNKSINSDAGYVGLINCKDITLENLSLNHNLQGVLLESNHNIIITNNKISNNGYGLFGTNSSLQFISNTLIYNDIGLSMENFYNSSILQNNISDSFSNDSKSCAGGTNHCIAIRAMNLNQIHISDNFISDAPSHGVYISGHEIIIHNNIISGCLHGIDMLNSDGLISNNSISNNSNGLYLTGSKNKIKIENNTIFNNQEIGFNFFDLKQSIVINNSIFNNHIGICSSKWNDLDFINNIFTGNMIYSNEIGINLSFGPNIIFNNYFNNTQNYIGSNNNQWNIDKVIRRNIIYGPYLGGNYWSNYNGKDLDDDYLGDTQVPFGPGDYHPLIKAPAILDHTTGIPSTNQTFDINASVFLKFGIKNVTLKYWFDDEIITKSLMKLISGNNLDGNYSVTLDIPINARLFYYSIIATSLDGQIETIPFKQLNVTDSISPTIIDISLNPITGENFSFNIITKDNIALLENQISYWFDSKEKKSLNISNSEIMIIIPSDAHILNYTITSIDTSWNNANLYVRKQIKDNIPPHIEVISSQIQTNTTHLFKCNITDNWEVRNVTITYWFNGPIISKIMILNDTLYEISITIPFNATRFYYSIIAKDNSENIQLYFNNYTVLDVIPPIIVNITEEQPKGGHMLIIQAVATDNIELKRVYIEYWINGEIRMQNMEFTEGLYSVHLNISKNTKQFKYLLIAEDISGNTKTTPEEIIHMKPTRIHVNNSLLSILQLLVIISIICSIIIWYYNKKKYKSKKKNYQRRKE
jgi:parallel beta-helix repeat protein